MLDAQTPIWLVLAASIIFGCTSFLAMRCADFVYASAPATAGRTSPNAFVALLPVIVSIAVGATFARRGIPLAALAEFDIVVFALSSAIWTDLTRGVVGNWFTLPAIAVIVVLAAIEGRFAPVVFSALFVTLPFAGMALLSRGRGCGWGEVKLVMLGALLLDTQTTILVFAVAGIAAIAIACAIGKRKEPIAFVPYLAAAIAIGLLVPATHAVAQG